MKNMWAIIFFAAGAALLIYGIGLVRDARQCSNWPKAEGRIVTSASTVVSRQKDKRRYAPEITYTYTVEGKEFQGNRITLVPRDYLTQSAVDAVLARYPVGGTVNVFYKPGDPANSILVNQPTGTEWAYPLAGIGFIVVGFFFLKGK